MATGVGPVAVGTGLVASYNDEMLEKTKKRWACADTLLTEGRKVNIYVPEKNEKEGFHEWLNSLNNVRPL